MSLSAWKARLWNRCFVITDLEINLQLRASYNRVAQSYGTCFQSALSFAGTIGRMIISFGFVIYLARYLGVEGFGSYELALSYFELFLSLSAAGLAILITRRDCS